MSDLKNITCYRVSCRCDSVRDLEVRRWSEWDQCHYSGPQMWRSRQKRRPGDGMPELNSLTLDLRLKKTDVG